MMDPRDILLSLGVAALAASGAQAQAWRTHEPHVLGASLDMTVVAADPDLALKAARAARAEIARVDSVFSRWRPDSELSRLNAGGGVAASPELATVIEAADRWRALTGGAFDPRFTGTLDLDAIAKGQAIDAALEAARRAAPDLEGMMVDVGGDLRVWGRGPSLSGWRVAVVHPEQPHDNADPLATLRITGGAVAFSGPGLRGGHILDPTNGRPSQRSAAVLGPSARDADALATALCVMSPLQGLALVDRLDGFEALVMDGPRHLPSRGWNALREPFSPPARLIRAQAAAPWPAGFAVTLDYEIPRQANPRAQPPYIAVWITDAGGMAVRTLVLMGSDDRFIDQNFIWWRKVGRAMAGFDALAKPTRRPGHYSLVWDGRDDHGLPLGQGRYTLHLEAVREHGGHGYQTFELSLGTDLITATAPPNSELGPSSVRFGPRR